MSFKALVYAYVIGGLTFIPVLILFVIAYTIYTSVPVNDADTRRGWLTMRRTFEEVTFDGSYVTLMKSFLDSRSKDPKRSRPRDMWYVVLKGKTEGMTECEAAIELGSHHVVIYPEGLSDGELFTKRHAICLRPKQERGTPSVASETQLPSQIIDEKAEERNGNNTKKKQKEKERLSELEKQRDLAQEACDPSAPWFIFVRSSVDMEDWYFSLIHASDNPANSSMLFPLQAIFSPADMNHLVTTLDEQPDVIPMRWLNALLGRIFFSYYNTDALESYVVGRLMKKLSKVKRPNFLSEVVVTEANMGNKPVMFSKPMLKELTKEGDAALELHVQYKGEMRITIKAVATISLGFKPYTVKLVLAVVLRELEGDLVVRVKRPPSNRIWYAFTHMPKMVLNVEPVVSDRQITWGMILHSIESRLKEIAKSIVLPNMDDITFFDSSSYPRRGGIWPEAGRREKPNVSTVPSAVDDDVPVTSVTPEVDPSPLLPSGDLDKSSHSEGDVSVEANHTSTPPQLPDRTTTLPTSRGSSPTPTHSHDPLSLNEHDPHTEDPDLLAEVAPLEAHRPTLRHQSSSISEKSKKKRFLGVRRTTRSPSPSIASHSSSRELSPAPSLENLRSSSPEPLSGGSNGSVRPPAKSPTFSSQSSLLSTLKSRAGDRQALSSTARETVRKWTVNWGGLKKDRDSSAASSEDARDGRNRSASQKVKSNYADIRAAVDGRREKERRNSDASSAPVHIPERGHKGRTDSVSSLHDRQGSSFSSQVESSPASSFVGGPVDPPVDETDLPDQPVNRPPTIDVDGAQVDLDDGTESESTPVTVISPPTPVPLPPRPIQSQPSQGKTMTIPGIHARHRGEVMSMGYVPPSPPAAAETKTTGVSSVYRLWKHSPAAQSEPAGRDDERARSRSPPVLNADGAAETTPESPPATATAPRPTAPPLPPRSPTSLRPVPKVPSGPSPASEALMSIVSRDELSRAGSEGAPQVDGGGKGGDGAETLRPTPPDPVSPKPPLPARKIHASA
ncbi:hypothetical protein EDB92DRAFT_1839782 [Lactarius akahatsu]|uniref:SMP-LTD domain-containing protein n=1 Tax=Lactarius akahatsu TaxID=416441 RepID=A0AAD4LRH3_9AGAM|nr:hypothetical protein EDB92DRAFT_1839782 [Lactarius akahatsu]